MPKRPCNENDVCQHPDDYQLAARCEMKFPVELKISAFEQCSCFVSPPIVVMQNIGKVAANGACQHGPARFSNEKHKQNQGRSNKIIRPRKNHFFLFHFLSCARRAERPGVRMRYRVEKVMRNDSKNKSKRQRQKRFIKNRSGRKADGSSG